MTALVHIRLLVALAVLALGGRAQAAFVTVDPQDDLVYRYDDAGVLLGSFALAPENDSALGIAAQGDAFYVLDRRNRVVYRYDTAGTLGAVSRELRQATGTPISTTAGAVAVDGDELWVVDRGRDRLFRYSLEEMFAKGGPLSAAQQIPLAGGNARAEGLALDDTYAYVLDQTDRKLYRYSRDGTGVGEASRLIAEVDGGSTRAPYGLALSGGEALVVDASRDKVFTYDLANLFTGSGPLAASAERLLDAANNNPRDVAAEPTTTSTSLPGSGSTTTSTTLPGGATSTTSTTTATTSTSTTIVGATTSSTTSSVTSTTSTTTAVPVVPISFEGFTVDAQDKRVYGYDAEGSASAFGLAPDNEHPSGIDVVADRIRVLDSADRRVYAYTAAGTLLAVSRELRQAGGNGLGTTAGAVAVAGDELWIVDRGAGKLLRYSFSAAFDGGDPLAAAQEIPLHPDNERAEGLAIDPGALYVLDQIDRQLYRYDRGGSVAVSGVMTGTDGSSLGAPYGAVRVDHVALVVDGSRDAVFQYDLATLFASGGAVAAIAETALDAANDDARDVGMAP